MNFHTFCIDGFFYLQVSSFLKISSASVQPDIPQSVLLHHEYNPDNCEVLFLFPHLSVPAKIRTILFLELLYIFFYLSVGITFCQSAFFRFSDTVFQSDDHHHS